MRFRKFSTSGLVRPYYLDESISSLGGFLVDVLIFIVFDIENPISVQC